MRTLLVALAIVLLTVPAYAQGKGGKRRNVTAEPQSEGLRKKRSGESEKAYKSALDKIPNKPPADPWGGMRATPQPKQLFRRGGSSAAPPLPQHTAASGLQSTPTAQVSGGSTTQ